MSVKLAQSILDEPFPGSREEHGKFLQYTQCNYGSNCVYWETDIQHFYCVAKLGQGKHGRKWYDPIGWRLTLGGWMFYMSMRLLGVSQYFPPRRGPIEREQ